MSDKPLNDTELKALQAFDTPTVCNALELLTRREAVILEACKRPDFTVAALKKAIGDAEEIH